MQAVHNQYTFQYDSSLYIKWIKFSLDALLKYDYRMISE